MSTLVEWRDEWLDDLEAGRPGPETIKVYRRSVDQFLTWLASAHPEVTSEGHLTPKITHGFMRHIKIERRMADSTRRVRGIALRKFLAYVADEPDSELDANPAAGLELPMPTPPPVPIIPDEDLVTLIKSMSGSDFTDRRDTAVVRLLLDTGCRRGELVAMNVDDVDLVRREVLVHGKGGRDRIVPFSSRTALALRKYLRARNKRAAADSAPLFLSLRPDRRGGWRMTGGGVADMLRRRSVAAGLPPIHPHQFRHSWAADLKSSGVVDDHLERLAGWSTPTMSRRYGNSVADAQARDAARKLARGDRV